MEIPGVYTKLNICLKSTTSLAPERDIFSEPAKSTRFSLPHFISSSPSGVASLMWIVMENKECDRLEQETEC